MTFWEIAGARNVVFFRTQCVSRMGRVRSPKRRVRDDDFILGYHFHLKSTPENFLAGAVFGEVGG